MPWQPTKPEKSFLFHQASPSIAVIQADHSLQRAKSCIFPGFGLTALTSYIFHPHRHTMVLLLQHNYLDFVFFNRFLFLLGKSSI